MPFFRRDHPLLRGCRIFAIPDGPGVVRNLVARGGTTTGTIDGAVPYHLGPHGGLDFDGVDDEVTWGGMATYGLTGRDLTVIARAQPDAAGVYGIVTCRQNTPTTTNKGFGLYFSNFGGAENGYVFVVYGTDGGNNFQVVGDNLTAAAQAGVSRVVAGTYHNETKTSRLYNGGGLRGSAVGAVNYDVRETDPIYTGRFNSGAYFNGKIGWIAVFDRCLTPGEIAAWSRDDRWPFFVDEEPVPMTGGATYATEVGVGQAYSSSSNSPTLYSTDVDALAYLAGDMTGGGDPDSLIADYFTEVRVDRSYMAGFPILVSYANVVRVNDAGSLTSGGVVTYATQVGVRSQSRHTIDGRRDLLGTRRYRR